MSRKYETTGKKYKYNEPKPPRNTLCPLAITTDSNLIQIAKEAVNYWTEPSPKNLLHLQELNNLIDYSNARSIDANIQNIIIRGYLAMLFKCGIIWSNIIGSSTVIFDENIESRFYNSVSQQETIISPKVDLSILKELVSLMTKKEKAPNITSLQRSLFTDNGIMDIVSKDNIMRVRVDNVLSEGNARMDIQNEPGESHVLSSQSAHAKLESVEKENEEKSPEAVTPMEVQVDVGEKEEKGPEAVAPMEVHEKEEENDQPETTTMPAFSDHEQLFLETFFDLDGETMKDFVVPFPRFHNVDKVDANAKGIIFHALDCDFGHDGLDDYVGPIWHQNSCCIDTFVACISRCLKNVQYQDLLDNSLSNVCYRFLFDTTIKLKEEYQSFQARQQVLKIYLILLSGSCGTYIHLAMVFKRLDPMLPWNLVIPYKRIFFCPPCNSHFEFEVPRTAMDCIICPAEEGFHMEELLDQSYEGFINCQFCAKKLQSNKINVVISPPVLMVEIYCTPIKKGQFAPFPEDILEFEYHGDVYSLVAVALFIKSNKHFISLIRDFHHPHRWRVYDGMENNGEMLHVVEFNHIFSFDEIKKKLKELKDGRYRVVPDKKLDSMELSSCYFIKK